MPVAASLALALALAAGLPSAVAAADAEPAETVRAAAGEEGPAVVLKTGERLPCREAPTVAFGRVAYTSPDGVRHALAASLVDLEATRAAARAAGREPAAATGGPPAAAGSAGGGALAPDFAARRADGTTVRLSDLRGKVVLLDFWATWCAPCVKDVPRLKALVESLADEPDFAVIGVSLDRDREALDAFVKDHGLSWPQAFDGSGWGSEVANAYGVRAIPHVALVDRQGRVARPAVRGADLSSAVRALLATPGEAASGPAAAPAPR